MRKLVATLGFAVLAAVAASLPALAQDWPNKPIRLIVPFPPGAGADISARIVAEALGPRLGQPVVVENRAGAGGAVGMDYVAKAPADGYTIGWPSADPMTMLPAVKPTLAYKVPEDFSYIAKFVETGLSFVISSNVPAKTMAEFVAYAKANPGKLRYGTSGVGGASHLATLLFERHAGVKMNHIPYKGVAPALTDLLGGHVDMVFITPATISPQAGNEKLRILAVTSPARHPKLPNVPTMNEVNLPGVGFASWYGIVGQAALPAAIQDRLLKESRAIIAMTAVKEKMETTALQVNPAFGKDFEQIILKEIAGFKALADAEKIVITE